jgi:hypothetical protein
MPEQPNYDLRCAACPNGLLWDGLAAETAQSIPLLDRVVGEGVEIMQGSKAAHDAEVTAGDTSTGSRNERQAAIASGLMAEAAAERARFDARLVEIGGLSCAESCRLIPFVAATQHLALGTGIAVNNARTEYGDI